MLCFDIANQSSFDGLKEIAEQIERVKESPRVPMVRQMIRSPCEYLVLVLVQVLVGCRSDLVTPDSPGIVDNNVIAQFAQARGMEYLITSSKSGASVSEAFSAAAAAYLRSEPSLSVGRRRERKDASKFFQRSNCVLH